MHYRRCCIYFCPSVGHEGELYKNVCADRDPVPNVIEIGQTVAEILANKRCFQNGGSLPSWTCEAYWATDDDYLTTLKSML